MVLMWKSCRVYVTFEYIVTASVQSCWVVRRETTQWYPSTEPPVGAPA